MFLFLEIILKKIILTIAFFFFFNVLKDFMVSHACNASTWEAKAREPPVQGELGLHSKTLPKTIKKERISL
jgi:hypothetical protein